MLQGTYTQGRTQEGEFWG